jgi:putative transposase
MVMMVFEDYKTKNHSKYLLKYHMIFVVKYRKRLLKTPISDDMKLILTNISKRYDFEIDLMECGDEDHIHILVSTQPSVSPLQIVNRLKQMSTIEIWKLYGVYLRNQFWNERTFWSDGYFVSSIGNVSEKTIKEYIENQG